MNNVLVTGAGGFIGSNLLDLMSKWIPKTNYYGLLRSMKPDSTNITYVYGNIEDIGFLRSIITAYDIDTVYHFAAQPIVSKAEIDPWTTFRTNIIGTLNILELCKDHHFTVAIQSTDKIYGEVTDATILTPINPKDLYGISKASSDMIAKFYQQKYDLPITIVRPCNIFGLDLRHPSRLIPDLIQSCLRGKDPVISRPLGGRFMTRQYMYIKDLVQCYTHKDFFKQKELLISSPFVFDTNQIAKIILEYFPERKVYYKDVPMTEIRGQSLKHDLIAPILKDISYTPFNKSIEETIEEYRKVLL